MVWALIITVGALLCVGLLWAWFRGHTIQDLVENPPAEVDLPEIVTILSYLHHELIKHRLPLVRSVADRPLAEVQPEDVEILKQAVTGQAERPSVTAELEGYLAGLRRASGAVPLNFWRDPLVRRARRACRMIQAVGDGLGSRNRLTSSEHRRLRRADKELDAWFRPRLQALRNSVLMLSLTEQSFREPVRRARQELGVTEAVPVVATGYGRKLATLANRQVTEITCHARGVSSVVARAGTLIDIGGQDSKVIVLDEHGKVADFAMNDKCAAGTGRFLESAAARLRLTMDQLAAAALRASGEVPISSTCTVFAESEIVSLIARGAEVERIVRGLHRALVRRVVALYRSTNPRPPVFLSGGVARSPAIRVILAEELGHEVTVPPYPQLMGALGAALIAKEA